MNLMRNIPMELIPRSPLSGVVIQPTAAGSGIVATDCDGVGLATVIAKKGAITALSVRMRDHFGVDLVAGPRRSASGSVAFAGIGPGAWLATGDGRGNEFARSLIAVMAGLAAVSDQTDAYAVLRLSGLRLRDALCKLVPIDLHPSVLNVGDVASTHAGDIAVTLWRLENRADGAAVVDVLIPRSMALSFWHAFSECAGIFGLALNRLRAPGTIAEVHSDL